MAGRLGLVTMFAMVWKNEIVWRNEIVWGIEMQTLDSTSADSHYLVFVLTST
jgi:hypothetical protein